MRKLTQDLHLIQTIFSGRVSVPLGKYLDGARIPVPDVYSFINFAKSSLSKQSLTSVETADRWVLTAESH